VGEKTSGVKVELSEGQFKKLFGGDIKSARPSTSSS
jgi:hypothetical protein